MRYYVTVIVLPPLNLYVPEFSKAAPKMDVYMENNRLDTFILPKCKDRDSTANDCWYNCDLSLLTPEFVTYENKSRILSVMANKAPLGEQPYVIFCKIFDVGTPIRSASKAVIVNVFEERPETKKNTVFLAPFIESFTEYGEITI